MAIKIFDQFAPRANVGDTNYPNGSIKNESVPGAKDGTPLDAVWGNDYAGFDAALFAEAGVTPSGSADTALVSQRLDATKKTAAKSSEIPFDNIADLRNGISRNGTIDMSLFVGSRVRWDGYYLRSDGGSNWGIIKTGAHTDDGLSIFSIDASTYVEANFSGTRVNIKKAGARESNTAVDNNTRINSAMLVAANGGTQIRVPLGRFKTGQHKGISQSGIVGYGRGSVLVRNTGLSDFGVLLFIEGASAAPADNIRDYLIKDVCFEGDVLASGFSEFKHLVMIQGGSDINIKRAYFVGFQGDGLVIRSGNNAYQNNTIRVSACEFDGVNKNNRNAISINDCVSLWITGSKFKNCTRPGNPSYDRVAAPPYDVLDINEGPGQPGAIDIEPNATDTFVRLRNIRIHNNEFDQIGGDVGCVSMFLPNAWANFDVYPYDISIQNNNMTNVFKAFHFTELQDSNIGAEAPQINLKVLNNTAKFISDRPFWIYGLSGVRMEGNFYSNGANASRIGWIDANRGVYDVSLRKERFKFCGTTDGGVINIYTGSDITIERTNFNENGVEAGGFGTLINIAGTVAKLKLIRNKTTNLLGRTTGSVVVTGVGAVIKGDNESFDNDWAGLDASAFIPDLTQFGESTINTTVTAFAGSGQANATQLSNSVNIITTAVSNGDSVKLPAATVLGRLVTIINKGAATANVYPLGGDNLGNGINVFAALTAGSTVAYKSYDSVNWVKVT